jgi:hypothetical protein
MYGGSYNNNELFNILKEEKFFAHISKKGK